MSIEAPAYPRTTFSPELVTNVGDIGKVLGEFLDEQKGIIQGALEQKFPGIGKRAVQQVLNAFITLEGTKRPLRKNQVHVSGMKAEQLDFCMDLLEKSRILRYEDGLFELAHDTLALRISAERSVAEVAFLEVVKLINDRFRLFASTRTLLNANELQLLRSVEPRLKKEDILSDKEWSYIKRSKKDVGRRRIILWTAVSAIIVILAATTIYSLQQRVIAQNQQTEAEAAQRVAEENLLELRKEQALRTEASYNQHLASGESFMSQSEYVLAIQEFDLALAFKEDGKEALDKKAQAEQLSGVRQQFERLIAQGDAFMNRGDDFLVDALNRYTAARKLGFQNVLAESKITTVNGRLPAAFDKFNKAGDTYKRVEDCSRALDFYRKALRIRPDDAELKRKMAECGN